MILTKRALFVKSVIKRIGTILRKWVLYPLMDLKFRLFGLPGSESKRLEDYLVTYNAGRYLSEYSNNKIKKVIVQIGMDKTASTTVQHFLAKNQEWLHGHSVEFDSAWGGKNHSVPLMSIFYERPGKIHYHMASGKKRKQILEYNLRNLRALCLGIGKCSQETYIFYGEGICSFTRQEYTRFRDFLTTLMPFARIQLLFCTRSSKGYASSAYQQSLKLGRYQHRDKNIAIYSNIYRSRMKNAIDVFGKERLKAYRFEDSIKHSFGPAGYFVEMIGLPAGKLESIELPRKNSSMSHNAIEILEYINEREPMVSSGRRNKNRVPHDTEPLSAIGGKPYSLETGTLEAIVAKAVPDIIWLRENFNLEYPVTLEEANIPAPEYDEKYITDCMKAFEKLNDFLKELFHGFILEKIRAAENEAHIEIFHRISNHMLAAKRTGLNSSGMQFSKHTKEARKNLVNYLRHYSNPNIKRVVIQMGMDKTATTSIQHFLAVNKPWLHDNSMEYCADWGSENHSIPLKSLVAETPERIYWHIVSGHDKNYVTDYNFRNLTSLCRGIRKCGQETYIFFGEAICGFHINELRNFKEMIEVLMPRARVEILHCVRSVEGYASSGYQQAVRMGYDFSKFKFMLVYSNIYFRRMIRAMMVFGRRQLLVYKFEDSLSHKYGPVGHFTMKLGIESDKLDGIHIQRINEGISGQAIEIIEFINKYLPMVVNGKLNEARSIGDVAQITKIKGSKFILPERKLKWLVRLSFLDLAWMAATFGIAYPKNGYKAEQEPVEYNDGYYKMFMEAFDKSALHIKNCLVEFVRKKMEDSSDGEQKQKFRILEEYIMKSYNKEKEV